MAEKLLKAKSRKVAAKNTAGRGTRPACPQPQIALVATYKERQLAWIKKNGVYNYPVKEGDEFDAEAFGKIGELWLYAGSKGERHCFTAAFVGKMTRDEFLAAYPTYAKLGRAASTKPPKDSVSSAKSAKDKLSLLGKSENREYYVFKTSFLDYGPKLEDPQVLIRAMDFATGRGRAKLVKKAFDQYKADGEFAPLAAYLPTELSAVPRDRLRVCDSGARLSVWSPVVGTTPQLEKIESIVSSVAEFGRNRSMTAEDAYKYLDAYAGLDFLDEHYSISRCYTEAMIDESLSKVCRNHGGVLK